MALDLDRIINRAGSGCIKYDARKQMFGREDIIPLGIADMDFPAPRAVIDALEKRAQHGVYGYTLRRADYFEPMLRWQKKRNGWEIDPKLITWSPGVIPSLSACIRLFTKRGDRILIQPPVYPHFASTIEACSRKVSENRLKLVDGRWEIDFEDFEKKLEDAKLFVLCSPHNPVGRIWRRDELEKMTELCADRGVPVFSDEIHSDIILFGGRHVPAACVSEKAAANVITAFSATKTFNLAGLQGSAAVFPNEAMKKKFDRFWASLDVSLSNCFSAEAVPAAYREGEKWLEAVIGYVEENVLYIKRFFAENAPKIVPNVPEATYLVWLDCRGLGMRDETLRRFFANAGVGLNPGTQFDEQLSGFMRLNAAAPRPLLEQALEGIAREYKKLCRKRTERQSDENAT